MPSSLPQIKAVLFDLDGTLIDSLADLAGAANDMLDANGYPSHEVDAYRHFIGDGVVKLVQRILPSGIKPNSEEFKRCLEEYKKNYTARWSMLTKPYPGIPELLKNLQAQGIKVGILSNKPHAMTVAMAREFFPAVEWEVVFGQREGVPQKPDPAGAIEAAELLALKPAEIAYLGDSGVDMETARAAGMFAFGAVWGLRGEEELRAAGANELVKSAADVATRVLSS